MALQLFIGTKNYSSWSMRPWVLLRQAGIDFEEVMVRFDSFEADSTFKKSLQGINPVGKVPVLVDDGFAVWDTLAIAEYLAERFPEHRLWPSDPRQRARARSVCAEMHSGFGALRNHCPMNIEASLPHIGQLVWRDQAALRADLARLSIWYFAPVCMRLRTYRLPLSEPLRAYVERVTALPGVQDWIRDALAEHDFLDFEEPYRVGPDR